jgi:formylglycine-generating enzyme required for sulfatase activity
MRPFSISIAQLVVTIGTALVLDAQSARDRQATPAAGDTKLNPKDGLKYAWISPGTFMMGCLQEDPAGCFVGGAAHQVTLMKGFWIGQTEVTQAAYERVVGENPSRFKGPTLPVENVNWVEAQAYCKAVEGRLPAEAEWEYAARAGSTGLKSQDLDRVAWHGGNSEFRTHDVGQKEPNAWKLYDMLGNVWEWVADRMTDLQGPPGEDRRVHRGGAWGVDPKYVTVSVRPSALRDVRSELIGVRCVLD